MNTTVTAVVRRSGLVGMIAVFVLALGLPQAGAITNGTYDDNTHPNVGIVFLSGLPATAGFCSGSLLSAHEFLTAGHCTHAFTTFGLTPDQVYVSFDERLSLSPDLVLSAAHPIAVTGWVTHPGFRTEPSFAGPTLANDVGVIHLAEDVSATPIDLPQVGFLDTEAARGGLRDHAFVNVGYGFNSLDRSFSSPQVNWTWENRREFASSLFMALTPEHLNTDGGACLGDSGGPVFHSGNLAVAIMMDADDACTATTVDQRLDTEPVRDFLDVYR